MSKSVARALVVAVAGLAVIIGILGPRLSGSVSVAQDRMTNLRGLLQELADDDASFLVRFTTPMSEDRSYWRIPGNIEEDGNIIGRRFVREIGDDYICVDEIGQGATFALCVPFTNIAYVEFIP